MKALTIFIILGILGTLAVGAYKCGTDRQKEQAGLSAPPETETVYGSASDKELGLYDVTYWLVQKGPFPNPSVLQQFARFYYKQTPDIEDVKKVVRIPDFLSRRSYVVCEDCPVNVMVLRKPIGEDGPVTDPEPKESE